MSPGDAGDPAKALYLLMAPYRGHWEIASYPNSRVLKANCGHWAWLSPQGETYAQTCYTVCCDCGEDLVQDPDSSGMAVPGALDYIGAHVSVTEMAELRMFMRRFGIQEQ